MEPSSRPKVPSLIPETTSFLDPTTDGGIHGVPKKPGDLRFLLGKNVGDGYGGLEKLTWAKKWARYM